MERDEEITEVQKFFDFLQGEIPEGVSIGSGPLPKLTPEQSMAVIWFAQECCHLIPENYEMCCSCEIIYDSEREGHYEEETGKCYCDNCRPEDSEPSPDDEAASYAELAGDIERDEK